MPTKSLLTCLAGAALLLPALATARPAYTVEPTRIHAGPGPDYPLIVVAPPGLGLEVTGCIRGYQWCDVIAPDGLRGWAWSGALSFSWNGPPLPVIEYGPSFGIPLISFVIGDYWGRYYRDRPWYDMHRHWRPSPPPHTSRPRLPGRRTTGVAMNVVTSAGRGAGMTAGRTGGRSVGTTGAGTSAAMTAAMTAAVHRPSSSVTAMETTTPHRPDRPHRPPWPRSLQAEASSRLPVATRPRWSRAARRRTPPPASAPRPARRCRA